MPIYNIQYMASDKEYSVVEWTHKKDIIFSVVNYTLLHAYTHMILYFACKNFPATNSRSYLT